MTWIQTLDGARFDLLTPNSESINPTTLARVLSKICRFGGHCGPEGVELPSEEFYSVAQHSLLVESIVENPELKLAALLHDAHEAYWGFGDICRPAKHLYGPVAQLLKELCNRVDYAIAHRFGINYQDFIRDEIKLADDIALATEARDLMGEPPCPWDQLPAPMPGKVVPLSIDESYVQFSRRLAELWRET